MKKIKTKLVAYTVPVTGYKDRLRKAVAGHDSIIVFAASEAAARVYAPEVAMKRNPGWFTCSAGKPRKEG